MGIPTIGLLKESLMLKITGNPECPYTDVITAFLSQEFNAPIENVDSLLDAVTRAFVGTGQVRQGPAPKLERLVAMRKVISHWMAKNEPIAVLVPWGSKKARNDMSVDVAELMALRQLIALRDRVAKIYAPGIIVDLGIEDLGGQLLWTDPADLASSKRYVDDFVTLVQVLDLPYLVPVPESTLVNLDTFRIKMMEILMPMAAYLKYGTDSALRELQSLGWKGGVSPDMVAFYLKQYARNYPSMTPSEHEQMLARYLSQSWARYQVNAKLKFPTWEKNYIQINFTAPIPGMNEEMVERRLFYRTVPMTYTRNHLPPWRAYGFLAVHDAIFSPDFVFPKLANVHELPQGATPYTVDLSNGRESLSVSAPYVLMSFAES